MLVFAGADLENAVAETMTAEFATSGQDCLGADRTHVERPVCDTFCAKSAEVTRTPTVQPRMDDRDIGALINVRKVGKGAMPACGGAGLPLEPPCDAESVVTDVPEGAAILAEQTFGAVVAIRPLDGENEVVRRASATEFGLAACLHTDDPRRIWRPSRALQ